MGQMGGSPGWEVRGATAAGTQERVAPRTTAEGRQTEPGALRALLFSPEILRENQDLSDFPSAKIGA